MSQSVKDSLADAETLRLNAATCGHSLKYAWKYGGMAELNINDRGGFLHNANQAGVCATEAARAAFKAVPGLRG